MTKRRKKQLIVASSALLTILLLAAFLARGWVRSTAVPAYVNHFYKAGVDKNFDNDFGLVNQKLSVYGLIFKHPLHTQDRCWKGADVMYEGLRETVTCVKAQTSDPHKFSGNFVIHWKRESPLLENYLIANGWRKEWNARQSIAELFNNPNNDVSIGVNYSKTHGKIQCELEIFYNAYEEGPEKVFVIESCVHDVAFFGGY